MHMRESTYGKNNGNYWEKTMFGKIPDIFTPLYDLVGARIHMRYLWYYKLYTLEIELKSMV